MKFKAAESTLNGLTGKVRLAISFLVKYADVALVQAAINATMQLAIEQSSSPPRQRAAGRVSGVRSIELWPSAIADISIR